MAHQYGLRSGRLKLATKFYHTKDVCVLTIILLRLLLVLLLLCKLPYVQFTPPTHTRQDSFVLHVLVV